MAVKDNPKFKKTIQTVANSPGSGQRRKWRTSAALTYAFTEGKNAGFTSSMLGFAAKQSQFKGTSTYFMLSYLVEHRDQVTVNVLGMNITPRTQHLYQTAVEREAKGWNFRTPGPKQATYLHNALHEWAEAMGYYGTSHKVAISDLLLQLALRQDILLEWLIRSLAKGAQ